LTGESQKVLPDGIIYSTKYFLVGQQNDVLLEVVLEAFQTLGREEETSAVTFAFAY
jgi:hypothetical protein